MHQDIIRYRTRPEQAAANEELVRAVYEELAKIRPEGLSHATFLLADRVTPCTWSRPSRRRARCWPCAPSASSRRASPTGAISSRSANS